MSPAIRCICTYEMLCINIFALRQTTNKCTSAMIVMSLQSISGCLIQAFMVGLVFAKLTRPKAR